MIKLFSAVILLGALTACHVEHGRVHKDGVTVEYDSYHDYPVYKKTGPRHCPPGHAKKGWC